MSAKRIEAGRKRDAPGYALEFRNFVKLVELLLMACLGAPTWHSRPEAFRRQDALQKQHLGPCHHGQHPRRGTAGSRGRRSGRMTVENSVLREGQQSVRPLRLSRKKPAGENSSYLSHSRHLHRRALPCPAPGRGDHQASRRKLVTIMGLHIKTMGSRSVRHRRQETALRRRGCLLCTPGCKARRSV
eukprot:s5564_g10.t2